MKFKSNIETQAGIEDSAGSAGIAGQLLSSLGPVAPGIGGVEWVDQSTIVAAAATLVEIECKNTSGSTITKGTPVYQTGNVGATAVIEIAEADALISVNQGPAIGLLQDTLINNAVGFVVIIGELLNFTTSPIDGVVPTVGDKIFVKSGGGLTTVKPTTALNSIQAIGLVGKVSGGNAGSVTVSSTMRANDVPNLPEGRIWIGDGNTIVSDTVYVDEPNNRVGVNKIDPDYDLDVDGAIRASEGFIDNEDNSALRVVSPPGGSYRSTSAITGAIEVTIPNKYVKDNVTFTLEVREAGFTAYTIKIAMAGNVGVDLQPSIVSAYLTSDAGTNNNCTIEYDPLVPEFDDVKIYIDHPLGSFATQTGIFITEFTVPATVAAGNLAWGLNITSVPAAATNRIQDIQVTNWKRNGQDLYYGSGTGDVGIGTTNPGSKLQVDGEIDANGGDGYRINGKAWANENANLLKLGDWDGEGFSTSIYDNNSANVVTIKDYGTTINCSSLITSYGASASLAVGTIGSSDAGAAVITLANRDGTTSGGEPTGTIQFAIKADNPSILGYTSAAISGSIFTSAGLGNSGGGILDFKTSPASAGSAPQTRIRINQLGNVGIGTTNPGAKLDVAGNIIVSGGVSNENDGVRVTNPGGASFFTGVSSVTGAIKITLPQGGINTMMRMEVKVYEYLANESFTVQCGGYLSGSNNWFNEYAYIESSAKDDRNFTVRFGYDTARTKGIIYIGELGSTWSYPQVFVTEFQGGYQNATALNYQDGWDISFETNSFLSVIRTQADTQVNNWARSGTNTYYASSTGGVGIGTTSPGTSLTLGTGSSGISFQSSSTTLNSGKIAVIKQIELGNGNGNLTFETYQGGSGGGERMRILNNGNVGIGTISPYSKLQVASAAGSDIPTAGTATGGLFVSNTNKSYGINMGVSGSGWGFIQSQRADGNATLYDLNLQPVGGNVGINDTTPSYKLDVNGEGRFTGDLRCLSLIQTSQSDKKEYISDIVKTTNKKIEFKEYVYKSDSGNRKRYGVLAEDIEVDYPELVHVDADGVKGVNYIDLLVKRVSELEKEIEDIAPRSMFLNWRGYHGGTNNGVLYDSGWSTSLTYPYATIIAPFKGSVTKVSITNNPYSSYQSGPTGDRATLEVVIDGRVVDRVTVNYSKPSANEIITFNFSGNHEFSENNKVQLRFQSNGLWRYINTGIQLKETI